MRGFRKLPNAVLTSSFWLAEKPISQGEAFCDLLLLANFEDVHKNGQTFKAGHIYRPTRELGERWGWQKDRVRRFLRKLEQEGFVRICRMDKAGSDIALTECATTCATGRATETLENIGFSKHECATTCATECAESKNIRMLERKGIFQNIPITEMELLELQEARPKDWELCLDEVSQAVRAGRYSRTRNYLALLLKWKLVNSAEKAVKDDFGIQTQFYQGWD